jgi:lactoylglutathione lyase
MGAFQTLGHINFKTRDLKASIAFYETLGFYLELTGGGVARSPGPEPTGFNHLCITVDDMDAALRDLEAAGIKLMHAFVDKKGLDNNRGAWIEDPDGNRIELMEMAPDCVQYDAIKAFNAGKGMTSLVRPLSPRK